MLLLILPLLLQVQKPACFQGESLVPCATPTPTPNPLPTIYTSAKSIWDANMEVKGRQSCEREKIAVANWKAGSAPVDGAMSYYDGEEVFLKIWEYRGSSIDYWKDCANVVERAYRGDVPPTGTTLPDTHYGYVFGNNGGVSGFWNFTDGIRKDFDLFADPDSKTAIHLITTHASYSPDSTPTVNTISVERSREVAYAIRGYINDEALGQPHRARYDLLMNQILDLGGHVDQWVNGTYRTSASMGASLPAVGANQYYVQPFMMGLTMRTIIQANAFKPDPRVYPAVKRMVEFVNTHAWIEEKNADGTSKNYGAWFYEKWAPSLPEMDAKTQPAGAPDLNMLIAPALAWLYSQDHDPKWLDIGDKAFAGAKNAYLDQDKQFNQNYTWSFEYVKWREGH